ncbi:FtsX-like permease family protein [Variovorax sp. VNK109]|uniref:FtsX-like permease family protein n=1 Tax=Variovorax sp. VNK109 TaxID=3400919 RepID=UPI003C0DBF41
MASTLPGLLRTFSWQELRHHPWRSAAAVVAVMLGVALAFAVQLINASALGEFASAVRAVNGQSDLELRATRGSFDETVFARVATHPAVQIASPVLELTTLAQSGNSAQRIPLRVLGIDALVAPAIAPALMPQPVAGEDRFAMFLPGNVFLNAAAKQALSAEDGSTLRLQSGTLLREARVAGGVAAAGEALAVMDIGAAQELFGRQGQLTRIDIRLVPGADRAALTRDLPAAAGVLATEAGELAERASNLSRAYRVNLTVLALVALFTGAFLVFSVLSLSVAKRLQQFALLGVLGLTPRERLLLVVGESFIIGVAGSVAGLALGTALASLALRLLGGDLGGGYFQGAAPALQWSTPAALAYGTLGTLAALAGGWWPARTAQRLPPAQALKGLGSHSTGGDVSRTPGLLLMGAGVLLAFAPPVHGIPLAAYISVGLLLVGGIATLPWLVALLLRAVRPLAAGRVLPMLALERARRMRASAAVAVSGVVASLSLAVALTVMVSSFRESVTQWLDVVLPAQLYVRSATTAGVGDSVYFTPELVQAAARVPGVQRATGQRNIPVLLRAGQPQVMVIARPLQDAARVLPLVSEPLQPPAGSVAVYVSEAMLDLYGARPGTKLAALAQAIPGGDFFVAGVWRDYARQSGSIAMDLAAYERLTGDRRVNDIALWLDEGADEGAVREGLRAALDGVPLEFASVAQIRATSLRIFDRSFAVTYWLQAVAIGIGLFGIAASFSAQVLARRKEFGLLAHLGLTRRQILAVVAGEGAAWTVVGAVAGLALGIAVSVVLVHVVNPQSFHWTMDLLLPWARLLALCAAVVVAGTLTAWLAGRAAAGHDAVMAVKEDW